MLTRWQTWAMLKGFCGIDADTPKELMSLPCDPQEVKPSEEDTLRLIAECQEYNKNIEANS